MNKKIFRGILFLLVFAGLCSCYAVRAYKFRKLKTMDHEKLPSLRINKGNEVFEYATQRQDKYPAVTAWLDSQLNNTLTHALVVIKNDTIVYEKYFSPYTAATLLPSFSIAKSFVSTLIAIALAEGKIKSLQEPVTAYLPELLKTDSRYANITLQHLLDMRSGLKWNEDNYGLKDDAIKLGFRPNMLPYVFKVKINSAPALDSEYKSINTLLLGLVLKKATEKPLVQYLEEKIWQPAGMKYNATWNTDKRGLPITYGGLNATAIDFAKLGSLYLHNGFWNGKRLVSPEWIQQTVNADTMKKYSGYRNQFWGVTGYEYFTDTAAALKASGGTSVKSYLTKTGKKYYYIKKQTNRFYAQGILGEFVYVVPEKNIVIVRLGYNWSHPKYYATALFEELWRMY